MRVPGVELCRAFYAEVVAPILGDTPHAAALLGDGSEVLAYDDEISTDHGFGPRVQIFLDERTDPSPVDAVLDRRMPEQFSGFPLVVGGTAANGGRPSPVDLTTASSYFRARLGVDPADGMRLADWLLTPTQRLATLTAGAVFHDPDLGLTQRRDVLAWYPDDVWRYVLAAGWLRISQEHAFVGRAGAAGDELGSRVVAARLVRDLMRLTFLLERRWAPYSKWLGRAFSSLSLGRGLEPHLTAVLTATHWRQRETQLCAATTVVGAATNDLGLAAQIDVAPRPFFDRDIRVVNSEGFVTALCDAIEDSEVQALVARLDRRADNVPQLPGAIDQAVDSTDVLTHPDRCRAMASVLGLTDYLRVVSSK